jgi:hypothetical protein
MNAEMIARARNGKRSGRGWLMCCPAHPDKNPSCTIADGDNGKLLVKCWAGCDARDILAALWQRGFLAYNGIAEQSPYQRHTYIEAHPAREWSPQAESIWNAAVPIIGTPAEIYLRGRGCYIPSCNDLRFLPARAI